jgi:hypothetical protein
LLLQQEQRPRAVGRVIRHRNPRPIAQLRDLLDLVRVGPEGLHVHSAVRHGDYVGAVLPVERIEVWCATMDYPAKVAVPVVGMSVEVG